MLIAHIITGLGAGGAEAMLHKLVSRTHGKQGCEHIVISLTTSEPYAKRIRAYGVPVYCLGMGKNLLALKALWQCHKMLRKHNPDILQGWMSHGNAIGMLMKCFMPKKALMYNIRQSIQDKKNEKKLTYACTKFNALTSRFAKYVINNSQVSIQQHHNIGFSRKNSCHIANGFDLEKYQPDSVLYENFRVTHGWQPETKIIGNVARFHPMKNHLGLIEFFAQIKKKYPKPLKLVMVGKEITADNHMLMQKIKALGLSEDCLLLGLQDSSKIMPVFDVYVSYSLWGEGFPNVLGEALACNVPCVASDVGDCRMLLQPFDNCIFQVNTPELVVPTICDFLNKPKAAVGTSFRQHIEQNYTLEHITQQYVKLYRRALGKTVDVS